MCFGQATAKLLHSQSEIQAIEGSLEEALQDLGLRESRDLNIHCVNLAILASITWSELSVLQVDVVPIMMARKRVRLIFL